MKHIQNTLVLLHLAAVLNKTSLVLLSDGINSISFKSFLANYHEVCLSWIVINFIPPIFKATNTPPLCSNYGIWLKLIKKSYSFQLLIPVHNVLLIISFQVMYGYGSLKQRITCLFNSFPSNNKIDSKGVFMAYKYKSVGHPAKTLRPPSPVANDILTPSCKPLFIYYSFVISSNALVLEMSFW